MEINLQGKDSVTVINAYAPTSSVEGDKVEQCYDGIDRAMADSDSRYKIITGDFNAKIGTKTKEKDVNSMGAFRGFPTRMVYLDYITCLRYTILVRNPRFGIRERNERGDRLIEFTEEHNLIIANTPF